MSKEIKVKIGGEVKQGIIDLGTLYRAERLLAKEEESGQIAKTRAIVWAALNRVNPDFTLEQVDQIDLPDLASVASQVEKILGEIQGGKK